MSDTYFDPSSSGAGILLPQVAAAAARDPRRLLVQSLMQQGQNSLQQPTYSGGAALAKALTVGLGGLASAKLNQDYLDQNQGVQDTMQRALAAGQGWTNPDTGKQAIAGNPSEMARILAGNPLTAGQGMQMQLQSQQMQAKAKLDLMNKLAEQHLTFDGNGNIVPMAGAPAAVSTLAGAQSGGAKAGELGAEAAGQPAVINATAGPLAAAAAQKETAINPALIARAGGSTGAQLAAEAQGRPAVINATAGPEAAAAAQKTKAVTLADLQAQAEGKPKVINATAAPEANAAAAKVTATAGPEAAAAAQKAASVMPVEVFKNLFSPVVDRATGEVTIPGMDPAVSAKVMAGLGIKPTDIAGSVAQPAGGEFSKADEGVLGGAPKTVPYSGVGAKFEPGQPLPSNTLAQPVPFGTKSPADEVPKVGLPTGLLPSSPGTLIPGRDPIAIKAGEGQVEQANTLYHETQEAAKAANASHAQLSTMRTQVQNGGVTPSATAPARFVLSSYLNATLGPDVAKSVTGIDPAQAEVLNKEATRMGLTFARQTEGAREAVAAIKIALGGNPSLGNTKEGFMKLVDLMDAGTQHDLAAQQYGDAYGAKNGHYVGFQGWMNQNHPPAEFTSKVIPYNLPAMQNGQIDPGQLQTNVTYNITSEGHTGPAIWTGQGFKPVQK